MTAKIEYIKDTLEDTKLRRALMKVVADVDALMPESEFEFMELEKLGLYPAEECITFVTKQGTPFYHLDNMSLVPKGDISNLIHYGDFAFRQIEILYNMARMDNPQAHLWLKDHLFQGCRVDARKKQEYKAKFVGYERTDWNIVRYEWMKYCLMLKYRDNGLFRKDLASSCDKLPIEDATNTNYASNLLWGARLIELEGKRYYFGCNVLGKLLAQLRDNGGKLDYKLPEDMHLFGAPIKNL